MAKRFHILMITFKCFALSVVLCSCTSTNHNKIQGEYVSKRFYGIEMTLLRPFHDFSIGMELNVNADSTFRYQTCGGIATGLWAICEDSLVLTPLTYITRRDSSQLNLTRFAFKIESDGELKRFIPVPGSKKVLDHLVRVEPGKELR